MIDWWQVIWADSPIKLYMMACCFVVVIGLGKRGGCEKESNLKKKKRRKKKKKSFFWQTFFLFYLLPFFLKWDKQFAFSIFFIYIFYDKLCFSMLSLHESLSLISASHFKSLCIKLIMMLLLAPLLLLLHIKMYYNRSYWTITHLFVSL